MDRKVELAWAAGLFEGEGTVTPKRGKGSAHRYQAAIIMTDEDVLRRFASIVGIGRFYGPYQPTNPRALPIWRWMTTKHAEIQALFELIGPWLGERRTKAFVNALADIAAHPAVQWFGKLSAELHEEIRRRYACGGTTQDQLAAEFGIHQSMVSVIVRRPLKLSTNKLN